MLIFVEVSFDCISPQNGWTALIFAVQNQKIEVIELLLSQPGLQINHVDTVFGRQLHKIRLHRSLTQLCVAFQMGRTALHWAAQDKKLDVLKLLLDHPDTDVTIRNRVCAIAAVVVNALRFLMRAPTLQIDGEDR